MAAPPYDTRPASRNGWMSVLDAGQLWFRCRACAWHSQPRSVRGADSARFFAAWDAAEADWTGHACGTYQGAWQTDTPPESELGLGLGPVG